VHGTIEREFYNIENFEGIKDFHQRVASYQDWYNLVRQNNNKDGKTPLQIITDISVKNDPAVARLPPLMLDWLGPDYITKEELAQRGTIYHAIPFKKESRKPHLAFAFWLSALPSVRYVYVAKLPACIQQAYVKCIMVWNLQEFF
jgi:hypothetical protein